jgi:hypothetical protein
MNCSPDIAISLLNSWRERSMVLNLFLAPSEHWPFKLAAGGQVESVTPETLRVRLLDAGTILLDITNATYDYSDAREALPELQEEINRDIVCTLQIRIPGYLFALGEPRYQLDISA